ncbi:MAG TPA: hypothetical protein VK935_03460 [Actinomycetospora sp.]|nr:hypothetical protein [Actinomycetospora sp.]
MGDIKDKLDKAYEDKSFSEIADAPVAALQGVSEDDAQKLKDAFNVKTIRDQVLPVGPGLRQARRVRRGARSRDHPGAHPSGVALT